jgi:iron complex transport system substrate-binding protein
MKVLFFLCIPVLLSFGCSRNRALPDENNVIDGNTLKYAGGFEIKEADGLVSLRIRNPWQQAENVTYEYWLGRSLQPAIATIPANRYFTVPVKKVVCLSSTFVGFIEFLNREHTIKGISGKKYVTCKSLLDKITSGEIPDVGYDENLNYERLVQLQPDVVFLYGITGSVSATIARLDELGIKSAVIAEYLEETPLARMEWIKYIGAFFDLSGEAIIKFDSVAANYNRLADLASEQTNKPTVLLGLPWSGTWYVSGGNSYMASLLRDAGSNYLWKHLPYKDSQPVSPEKVFEKAFNADFWLNAGDANSKADILKVDDRFSQIKAFREDAVYNNNNQVNAWGGNAYFEQGVVEPDIILADIISVLHPHLLPSYHKKYYRKLD